MKTTPTYADRLERHTDTSDPSACWEWGGYIDRDGYARVTMYGKGWPAARLAYIEVHGSIPDGFDVDHLCRNRACVNPSHLEAVTRRTNLLRRPHKTHCRHGHELNEQNAYMQGGRRQCRPCNRRRVAEYNERRKSA